MQRNRRRHRFYARQWCNTGHTRQSPLGGSRERVSDACELGHAVMKAGSIVFVGGKTRHGGGTNISGEARRAIGTSFVLGWLRTQQTRFLHTTVEQAQQWAQRARQLLGYDLYSHYDEALMAGPLDDYEYGSLPALFENKT
jgi:ectoine hydroxylase-related dioxygenase (phytanoyl-CoA dioxygenase family)